MFGRSTTAPPIPQSDQNQAHSRATFGRLQQKRWFWIGTSVYLLTILSPSLDRFLTWDEAVFYSQSGGLDGVSARQRHLVASRELGSSALIALLRLISHGLASLRLVWASLTYALLLLSARRLRRHIGDTGALTFLVVYGTFWLVVVYAPAFYANALFAVLALLTTTSYLDLLGTAPSRSQYLASISLGLTFSAAFWMRPLEAGLLAASLFLHLVVLNIRRIADLLPKLGVASVVAFLLAGMPWILDSHTRFGSVSERVQAAMAQPGQARSGLRFNLDEYLGMWVGDFVAENAFGPVPSWPRWIIYAGILATALYILRALKRSSVADWRGPTGVFVFAAFLQASFFLFWRAPVTDRYFFGAMIFAAALLGWAAFRLEFRMSPPVVGPTIGVAAAIWLLVQVLLIMSYDTIRTESSATVARVAATMRTIVADRPCRAISRFGAPQVELASGCVTTSYSSPEDVLGWVSENREALPSFIYGPYNGQLFESLPDGWTVIPVQLREGKRRFALAFWLPPSEDDP